MNETHSCLCGSGDHQPDFASSLIDPTLDDNGIAQRLMAYRDAASVRAALILRCC